jgi:hypothetical protein
LAKKNNSEQCLKTLFQPEQLLKVPEQKSGFIVEQWQKPLFEQNYDPKSHIPPDLLTASADGSKVITMLRLTLTVLQA